MLRCGIDLIEIERVEGAIQRHGERFLTRIYTPGEIEDCAGVTEELAARFAAKEAVSKALGTGIGRVRWNEIEVRRGPAGEPLLHLYGQASGVAEELGLQEWSVSLTHARAMAAAVVVAMG
jgi:holo-[acyl-carrier protein] synthase